AATAAGHGRVADLFQHVLTFDQLAENRVLVVEEWSVVEHHEELRAGGVRMAATSHREDALHMLLVAELGLDLVAWITRAPVLFLACVFRERIAALDHEALDDA